MDMTDHSIVDSGPQGSGVSPADLWRRGRRTLFVLLTSVGLAVVAQIMLKAGMNRIGFIHSLNTSSLRDAAASAIAEPMLWGGLILFALSGVLWLIILSRVPLSLAYPFVGLGYIVIVALSRFALHERVSLLRWTGAVLVAVGVVLIGMSSLLSPSEKS